MPSHHSRPDTPSVDESWDAITTTRTSNELDEADHRCPLRPDFAAPGGPVGTSRYQGGNDRLLTAPATAIPPPGANTAYPRPNSTALATPTAMETHRAGFAGPVHGLQPRHPGGGRGQGLPSLR
jgi:hypothetical protein